MTNLDYLYNPAAAKDLVGKNHFVDRKLHFQIIEHGTILPHKHLYINGNWIYGFGGIVDRRGEFIKSSFVRYGDGDAYTPTEDIKHSNATVIYLGLFYLVWGHAITDNVRRLWFLKSEVFNRYFKNCRLVYLPWGGGYGLERQQNFRRLLEILEVDVNRLQPITQPTQFENIILPDESFFPADKQRKFTAEYRETIERVKDFAMKNQTPTSAKKIYYFYGRKQIGEERLAEYFRSKGYEIVSPERLTLDQQLNLLINAESFASTLGSCSHNAIFLREGTEVILIPRSFSPIESFSYQEPVNQLAKLNATYIDSTMSVFNEWHDLFCYIISRQLKNFFGDEFSGYTDDDFKIFLAYTRHAMSLGRKVNPKEIAGYGAAFADFMAQLKKRTDLIKAYGITFK